MVVQVRRICTIFYVESVLKIFASFTLITYGSNMYEHINLVSFSFSRDTKMCSGTTDCKGLSSTYSYVHHSTRMTVSFMFCALVASYGVCMVVRAVLVNHSGQSPLTLTHLIHEYHVNFPWKVCRPVASAAQH